MRNRASNGNRAYDSDFILPTKPPSASGFIWNKIQTKPNNNSNKERERNVKKLDTQISAVLNQNSFACKMSLGIL